MAGGKPPAPEGQRRPVVGGYVPRPSLSASGKQLTGVFDQGGAQPHALARGGRNVNFRNGIYASQPARPRPAVYGSSYVPEFRGYTGVVRSLSVKDQMQQVDQDVYGAFKPQNMGEPAPASSGMGANERRTTRKSFKDHGRRAYKAEYKENRESRRDAPIRAKSPR